MIPMSTAAWGLVLSWAFAGSGLAEDHDEGAPPLADVWEELDLKNGELQRIALPAGNPSELSLVVSLGGETYGLDLQRHSLRGDHFEVLVQVPGGGYETADVGTARTFQGRVVGPVGGRVAASLVPGGVDALVLLDDGRTWTIQPAGSPAPGWHIAYRDDEVRDGDWRCGNDLLPRVETPGGAGSPPGTSSVGDRVCEIAWDADREFYAKNGSSVVATVNDIENILNGVVIVYERDVQITWLISTILVRTVEPDPYSSSDAATLLDQFENQWGGNHPGIHRDIAHLMTGKNLNGGVIGVAWLGTICSGPRSYGLSESRFTTNYNRRVTLTAHELGHNWQADHCNGDGDCHIMCSFLGGCQGIGLPNFGTGSAATIVAFSRTTPCTPREQPPAPIDNPFFETWDNDNSPDAIDWEFNQGAFISTGAANEATAPNSLQMSKATVGNDKEEIRTKMFALQGESDVTLSYYTQHGGPDNGESLICEYFDANGDWIELGRAVSDGSFASSFAHHRHTLPAGALYDGVRFRFRTDVDDIFDFWYLDNVKLSKPPVLTLVTPPSPGQTAQADITGLRPHQSVTLLYSLTGIGQGPCFFQNVCFDLLGNIYTLLSVNANASGTAQIFVPIPGSAPTGVTVYLQGFAGYTPARQSDVTNAIPATVQ